MAKQSRNRALYDYTVDITNMILFIYRIDEDESRLSLTNDMENIIYELGNTLDDQDDDIRDFVILYEDSNGIIDEVELSLVGRFKSFNRLNSSSFYDAKTFITARRLAQQAIILEDLKKELEHLQKQELQKQNPKIT